MRVNEERLAELSAGTSRDRRRGVNQVVVQAALELAAGHPHAGASVEAADAMAFLLDDLGPDVRLRVAADAIDHVSMLPGLVVGERLAMAAQADPVLGVACQAIAACRLQGAPRPAAEREAVERALYLVLRMAEVQEEVDALHASLGAMDR